MNGSILFFSNERKATVLKTVSFRTLITGIYFIGTSSNYS